MKLKIFKPQVAVINIEGPIIGGAGSDNLLKSYSGSDSVLSSLYDVKTNNKYKGLLLRINSPGGSPAASQEIYEMLKDIRAVGKPVIASVADCAASGGYMIACGCDKIVATSSSFTGSIGVIMQVPYYEELAKKVGYSTNTIKSGEMKDIGNPMRPMTDKEKIFLQDMSDGIHHEFIQLVADGRNLPYAKIEEIADGRIFTGRQAYELKLVDAIGHYYDAIDILAKKISPEFDAQSIKLVYLSEKKKGLLGKLASLF